jgi:predicted dienelactone hydrolase
MKQIISILLAVLILAGGLCSCQLKKDDEKTAETTVMTTVAAVEEETVSETVTETTTAAVQTTAAPTTVPQTQQEVVTEAPEITGVKTITDGNKTVVYPLALESVQKTYPVISWANGTGCPTQLYAKLLEAIANGGYIVVADSSVMSGDGTAQIDSVNYILNKNSDSSSVFYNKVDTYAIGVCGQSQGGRSCINAAQKDSRIRCVVSIAGASTADEARGLSVPCFFITGTSDNIVDSSKWCKPSYDAVTGRAAYASIVGGTHLSFSTHTATMAEYTVNWFDAYLKGDDNAKQVFYNGGKLSTDGAWTDFQNKN